MIAEPVEALRPNKAGLRAVGSTSEIAETPEIVVLAVKPQTMDAVLPDLKRFAEAGSVFLSIAAGKTLRYFASHLGVAAKVVRSMPNTPAAVQTGITVACASSGVSAVEKKRCPDLLEAVGQAAVGRRRIAARSGDGFIGQRACLCLPAGGGRWPRRAPSSGSSPRWPCSLRARPSRAAGSCSGQSGEPAHQLRINVTSPGGTTAEALKVLMAADGIQPVFDKALAAASRRSKELAG